MAFSALKGSLNQTIDVWIEDSSNAGFGKTGLGTGTVTCLYRHGATATPTGLTLATQIVGGAHTDGGFVEVSGGLTGVYRLDLSDLIVASGAEYSTLILQGADAYPCKVRIELFDALTLGSDHKVLISETAQDLSSSFDVNAKTMTDGVINSGTLAAGAGTKLADFIIRRNLESVRASVLGADTTGVYSLYGALCKLISDVTLSAGTLTVKDTQASPVDFYTQTYTTGDLNPIVSVVTD